MLLLRNCLLGISYIVRGTEISCQSFLYLVLSSLTAECGAGIYFLFAWRLLRFYYAILVVYFGTLAPL